MNNKLKELIQPYEWLVNFGSGYCCYTSNHYSYVSRAVVDLKSKNELDEEDGQ